MKGNVNARNCENMGVLALIPRLCIWHSLRDLRGYLMLAEATDINDDKSDMVILMLKLVRGMMRRTQRA